MEIVFSSIKISTLYVLIILAFIACDSNSIETIKAQKGHMDLRNIHNPNKYMVALDGEWEIHWNQWIQPGRFLDQQKNYYELPLSWNDLEITNQKHKGGKGFATLKLNVFLPAGATRFGIQIRELSSSYDLYLNGDKVLSRGVPGDSISSTIPEVKPALFFFNTRNRDLELIIHLANFHHRKGGAWHKIYFGQADAVQGYIRNERLRDILLLGILFIIAIYHFGLYLIRRKDLSSLVFSLFCLDILIRHGLINQRLLMEIFPAMKYSNMLRIEYATMFFGIPVALNFFHLILPGILNRFFIYFFYIAAIIFTLFCTIMPVPVFTESILYFQPVLLIGIACGVYLISVAAMKKRPFVWLLGLGVIALSVSLINDVLFHKEIIDTGLISQYGFFVLILTQAFVLSMRFARAFHRTEELSKNLESLNVAYGRFVPSEFLMYLQKKDVRDIELGDQVERDMTVLLSDIRSFSDLSEKMTTRENFQFINSYLGRMTPIISQNNGFIDKYIGDAIMALFPENSQDALDAAISMQQEIRNFNNERIDKNQDEIRVGIGLHSGNLMLGTIGSDKRMDCTVISEAVNIASRIEKLTKIYQSSILISESVIERTRLKENYQYRMLDYVFIKGQSSRVRVFEVLNGQSEYQLGLFNQTFDDFSMALDSYFQNNYRHCVDLMKKVLKTNPHDHAAKIYLNRCQDNSGQ